MIKNWIQSLLQPWRSRPRFVMRETIPGLGAPVEVRLSERGICHVFAENEEDMFRAQGYITARDRLFQMDTARRSASGRLAEWYGDVPGIGVDPVVRLRGQGLASVDYLMRVFGLQQAAEDGLSWLSPHTHKALLAYAEGVNEWMAAARKQRAIPLPYKILDAEPEEWRPTDSLLLLRLLAFRLSFSWRLLLAFGALSFRLFEQPEKLRSLLPPHQELSLDLLSELAPFVEKKASSEPPDEEGEETLVWPSSPGQGSCAWVVTGQRTRSGGPILCNDPHLTLRLPAAFYQIRLHAGSFDTIGLSIPGHPGIYMGHNAHIGWGASLSRVDDADIFLEELSTDGHKYRHRERMLPLIRREEVIRIRGEQPRHRWVRSTLRGPLLSDAVQGPMPAGLKYSLAWTGHEGVRETEALIQINRATNWQHFRDALHYARVPSLGFVYADRSGNIGGMIAGRCPKRPQATRPFHPLPGADGDHDWQGDVPFEQLPHALNPECGYLILSGQRPDAPLSEHPLQGFWEPRYRAERIEMLLQRKLDERHSAEHMGRLQRDHYSLWSRDFIQRVLGPFDGEGQLSPPVRSSLQMLLEWNGRVGAESLAAPFFAMFQLKLAEQAYSPVLGEDLFRRWTEIAHELEPPVEALFRAESEWLERGRKATLHAALTQAFHGLQKRLGGDPNTWTWNQLHRLHLRPIFFWDGDLVRKLYRGPLGTGGDGFCLNAGTHSWSRPFEHRVGASARQILDLSLWDHSQWILCGGQSEDHRSRHYDDQLDHWMRGDALPMLFTPSTLHTTPSQWLLPSAEATIPPSYLHAIPPYRPLPEPKPSQPPSAGPKEREP